MGLNARLKFLAAGRACSAFDGSPAARALRTFHVFSAKIPSTAAFAPAIVVKYGSRISSAVRRIENESLVPFAIGSVDDHRDPPFLHRIDYMRAAVEHLVDALALEPELSNVVARCRASRSARIPSQPGRARSARAARLSSSRTLMNTSPVRQIRSTPPAPPWQTPSRTSCRFPSPRRSISSRGRGSYRRPEIARKGNTDSFTATCLGTCSVVKPDLASFLPAITSAAYFASGTPIALLTNGIVREARGFTSRI